MRAALLLTTIATAAATLLPPRSAPANAAGANTNATATTAIESAALPPSLCGRVLDENDQPIPQALILAISAAGFPSSATISQKTGRFSFSDLPPGRYVLIAIHGHHSPGRSDPVVVGQLGSPFPIRVTMTGGPIHM